jgi:hypothetical protein
MTLNVFKDLKKFVAEQEQRQSNIQSKQLSILRHLPFYIWDEEEHKRQHARKGDLCCFNHAISLPQKHGVEHPLYDYQKLVFDALFTEDGTIKDRHVAVLKASGIGLSELALRIVAWLCLKDDNLKGSQICHITGPRIDLSVALMQRLKQLFYRKNLVADFGSKETVAVLNNVRVECFPSHHLSSMRGLDNVSMIVADEAAFFNTNELNMHVNLCCPSMHSCTTRLLTVSNTAAFAQHVMLDFGPFHIGSTEYNTYTDPNP